MKMIEIPDATGLEFTTRIEKLELNFRKKFIDGIIAVIAKEECYPGFIDALDIDTKLNLKVTATLVVKIGNELRSHTNKIFILNLRDAKECGKSVIFEDINGDKIFLIPKT